MLRVHSATPNGFQLEVILEGDSFADLNKTPECRELALDVAKKAMAMPLIGEQVNRITDAAGHELGEITNFDVLKTARFFKRIVFSSGTPMR